MAERSKHLEKALRECVDAGLAGAQDPWPEIRRRLNEKGPGERPPVEARAGQESADREPRGSRRPRFVPDTPLGYALAVFSVLIVAAVAYAASGPVSELARQGLPGGVASDSAEKTAPEKRPASDKREGGRQEVPPEWAKDLLRDTVPGVAEANLDERLGETRTVGGVTVTLERAYADEGNVVIVYSTGGWDNEAGHSGIYPMKLTDGSGASFESVGNLGMVTDPSLGSKKVGQDATVEILDPSERLQVSRDHGFRLTTRLDPNPGEGDGPGVEQPEETKPLAFDFTVPVHGMNVIDVGQTVEANGIRMTLDRVENSPARSRAFLCFEPPRDEKYNWLPWVRRPGIAQSDVFTNDPLYDTEPGEPTGCLGYDLFRSLHGKPGVHSFTVTKIEGRTRPGAYPEETIRGPWTFEFEVPR